MTASATSQPAAQTAAHSGGWSGVMLLTYAMLMLVLGVTALGGGHVLAESLRLAADGFRANVAEAAAEDVDHIARGAEIVARPLVRLGIAITAVGGAALVVSIGVLARRDGARRAGLVVVCAGAALSLGALAWYVLHGSDAMAAWSGPALEIRARLEGGRMTQPETWEGRTFAGAVVLTILHAGIAILLLRSLTSRDARSWCGRG